MENCIEDVLGYEPPKSDKPYKAYCYINENWDKWEDINDEWRKIIQNIFNGGNKIKF